MRYEDSDYGFEAKIASREAVPALIGLWSASGGGKTFSALLLARGLVGPKGKIAMMDTENGRAKFYSDVSAPWFHLDIQPPFTPQKYSAAFKYLRDQGADVIIVDSGSHVWEGEGGILDMAESAKSAKGNALQGLAKWKNPKLAHKRMMNDLMRSPVHVIFCLRQKDIMKTVKDDNGKDQYVFDRHVPIAEKNFIFEMTVALRLTKDGFYDRPFHPYYYKVPAGLKDAIPEGGQVKEDMGKAIASWLAGGVAIDKELAALVDRARQAADQGSKAYQSFFESLTAKERVQLKSRHEDMKQLAADVDIDLQREADYSKAGSIFDKKQEPAA